MYPKSRQTIIGKKFTSRDVLVDRYQEITGHLKRIYIEQEYL